MNGPEEFKHQQQLEEKPVVVKVPRSPRFDLIWGIILGAVAMGILLPAIAKHNARKSKTHHALSAKSLDDTNPDSGEAPSENLPAAGGVKSEPAKKVHGAPKALATVKTAPKTPSLPLPIPTPPAIKAVASIAVEKKETLTKPEPVVKVATPPKAIAQAQEKEKEKEKKEVLSKTETPVRAAALPKVKDNMADPGIMLTANDIAAKTDEALLANLVNDNAQNKAPYITIYNSKYQKDTLANCKLRCLLVTKDEKGVTTNAVISGPNFADILKEFQGTINLTGKKTTFKSHEVFMVQNITFNTPAPKKPALGAKSAPLKVYKGDRTPATEGYEDLGSDLNPR